MTVQNTRIDMIKGDDQTFILSFVDSTGVIDISLWSVSFVISDQKTSVPVISKIVTSHTEPLNGITEVHITHEESDSITGSYKYVVKVTTENNEIKTILTGMFVVTDL
jgi:hypothetical protein